MTEKMKATGRTGKTLCVLLERTFGDTISAWCAPSAANALATAFHVLVLCVVTEIPDSMFGFKLLISLNHHKFTESVAAVKVILAVLSAVVVAFAPGSILITRNWLFLDRQGLAICQACFDLI